MLSYRYLKKSSQSKHFAALNHKNGSLLALKMSIVKFTSSSNSPLDQSRERIKKYHQDVKILKKHQNISNVQMTRAHFPANFWYGAAIAGIMGGGGVLLYRLNPLLSTRAENDHRNIIEEAVAPRKSDILKKKYSKLKAVDSPSEQAVLESHEDKSKQLDNKVDAAEKSGDEGKTKQIKMAESQNIFSEVKKPNLRGMLPVMETKEKGESTKQKEDDKKKEQERHQPEVEIKKPIDTRLILSPASSISSVASITHNAGDDADDDNETELSKTKVLTPNDLTKYYTEDPDLPEKFEEALQEIIATLGFEKLELEYDQRQQRQKDDWSYHVGKVPLAIVYPETTEDVSSLMRICYKYHISVVAFGCGTSLEGHTISLQRGILCNMSKMDRIVEVHEKDADVVVQAGVQWMELNNELDGTKLYFPMDPGPGASIGGMLSCCCSGTNAVKYGVMKDWVLSITVVLCNGEIIKIGSRARKDVAGYDLTRLFVGAEGTLGIITEATLKLTPKPEHHLVAVCSFPSTHNACETVSAVVRKGIQVSGAEYLDSLSMKIVNAQGNFDFPEKPTIMFKFSGSPMQLKEAESSVREICDMFHGDKFQYRSTYESAADVEYLWSARKDLLFNAIAWSQDRESWITDVCVPIGELPNVIQATIDDIEKSPLDAPVFGHVGDGNFHAAMLIHPDSDKDIAEATRLNERMIQRAIAVQGTCTGEHGVGEGKTKYLKQQVTPEALNLMILLKRTLDPYNLLNPGKIFNVEDVEKGRKYASS